MTRVQDFYDEQSDDAPGAGVAFGALTPEQRRSWRAVLDGGWKVLAMINQGLSDAGFSAPSDLRVLEVLGRERRLRISDIASATHIQMSTVSRQIGRLVEQGWVERVDEVRGDDARHRWVRLTAAGREHLTQIVECRDAQVREHVVAVLGEDDFCTFGTLFQRLADEAGEVLAAPAPEEG